MRYYHEIAKELKSIDIETLKTIYPVDIYSDEKLGDSKSLTLRVVIQSQDKTLEDSDIEVVIDEVMQILENKFQAKLR